MTSATVAPPKPARVKLSGVVALVMSAIAVTVIVAMIGLGVGLAQGYRPVVLTSGSMSPTAPTGSLVVARPTANVVVGDILVMPDANRATVTHRVVEIETNSEGWPYAVTQGDANEEVDPAPYRLVGEQLVGRWVLPGFGTALLWLGSPLIGLVVIGGGVLALTMMAISSIWRSTNTQPAAGVGVAPAPRVAVLDQPKRKLALMAMLATLFGSTGIAWSLYLGTESIPGNAFTLSDCFDAQVGSVQTGQLVSSSSGLLDETISAVAPSTSFLTYSVRSASSRPGDSVVLGNLVNSTTIRFHRDTTTATPPPIVIEWAVVEYDCGVTVQRGSGYGDGTVATDFTIAPVDPTASFVLGGSMAARADGTFNLDDDSIVELIGADTVRFRHQASLPVDMGRALEFQVVTFSDPGDARAETVSGTIPSGALTQLLTLSQPVDVNASMLIVNIGSASVGNNVGQRAVRARLVDSTTVELERFVSTLDVEVSVQVVQFFDGTTVGHGIVDMAPAQTTVSVSISPVDLTRATAMSSVVLGGAASGGATDETSSGEPGEASVTVALTDATTVRLERTAANSSASFAWQVISWGGPSWADPGSPFRQRIDVDAATIDVPSGYTTSLTFDHAAMVSSGLSSAGGNDLRLWRYDGTSWSEIDRVLDESSTWDSGVSTFWFRTSEPIAATTTVSYWLYFGNPTPSAPLADPNNVWLLDEGFESGLGTFEDRTTGTDWYRAEPWTRRIQLSIDPTAVPIDLVGVPVLVRVVDADLGAQAQPDGSDIYFTDAGGTRLSHDIEAWQPGTGTLTAWVRVPNVSTTVSTTVFAYYGASDAPLQADARGTWTKNGLVWNMDRDTSGPAPSLDDRGEADLDGRALDNATRVATSSGFAARLDGVGDRLESAPVRLPDTSFTVSAWFRADVVTGDVVLMAQGDPTTTGVFELGVDATTNPGNPVATVALRSGGATVVVSGGPLTVGTWHHVAAVWDQTSIELFVDGASSGSAPTTGGLSTDRTDRVVLGGNAAGGQTLDGDLGQARLRFSAVTAEQLSFEAANLANPGAVIVSGAPVTGTYRDQGTWSIRRPLVVDRSIATADLVDFPLLVELVDADLAAGAQADGDDLVFTAADGVTRLDHHIESWNSVTGALTAWVRVPLVSATVDTNLFVYLGSAGAGDQTDPAGVWGSDADLVLTGP